MCHPGSMIVCCLFWNTGGEGDIQDLSQIAPITIPLHQLATESKAKRHEIDRVGATGKFLQSASIIYLISESRWSNCVEQTSHTRKNARYARRQANKVLHIAKRTRYCACATCAMHNAGCGGWVLMWGRQSCLCDEGSLEALAGYSPSVSRACTRLSSLCHCVPRVPPRPCRKD